MTVKKFLGSFILSLTTVIALATNTALIMLHFLFPEKPRTTIQHIVIVAVVLVLSLIYHLLAKALQNKNLVSDRLCTICVSVFAAVSVILFFAFLITMGHSLMNVLWISLSFVPSFLIPLFVTSR